MYRQQNDSSFDLTGQFYAAGFHHHHHHHQQSAPPPQPPPHNCLHQQQISSPWIHHHHHHHHHARTHSSTDDAMMAIKYEMDLPVAAPALSATGSDDVSSRGDASPSSFDHNMCGQQLGRSHYRWMKSLEQKNSLLPGRTRTGDKYRIAYTDFQRFELEKEFILNNRYITQTSKSRLADRLNLSVRQVKIWFQNRRAKDRKQIKRRLEENNVRIHHQLVQHNHHGYVDFHSDHCQISMAVTDTSPLGPNRHNVIMTDCIYYSRSGLSYDNDTLT